MYAHRFLAVVRPQAESVVAKVLAGLDVVLVFVCPVERDLLALVGDGVDAGLVDSLGEEIAVGVIATEEAIEVIVDLALQSANVHSVSPELRLQLLDLGRIVWVDPEPLSLRDGLAQVLLDPRSVGALVERKRVLHLRQ